MRMIREPCARYSPVPSEPCSEQDRAREQFHLPVVAAQHAEAERSAPTASRAPLPGNRKPLPDGFETHSSFTLSIHAARNCQPRRKRSEEHTSELQSLRHLVCRLLLEKKKY